jgi:hypothetical protein
MDYITKFDLIHCKNDSIVHVNYLNLDKYFYQ